MQEIIKPFKKSLFDKNIRDIGVDMFEIGIDSFTQEGPLNDMPIVGSIVRTCKFAYNIHDRNLLRQTLVFIDQFNNNLIDPKKLEKHKKSLEDNVSKAEKELGRVLIILNKTIDSEKATILAKLYSAYINQNVSWEDFCELSEVTDRLFVKDINILMEIYTKYPKGMYVDHDMDYVFQRLASISLIRIEPSLIPADTTNLESDFLTKVKPENILNQELKPAVGIVLTQLGQIFCSLIK